MEAVDENWQFFRRHDHQEYESRAFAYNQLDLKLMKDMVRYCDRLLESSAELERMDLMVANGISSLVLLLWDNWDERYYLLM